VQSHQSAYSKGGPSDNGSRRARAVWWSLLIGATVMGLYAWRYALPRPFSLVNALRNNFLHPREMTIHAITASLALLIAPWQLSDRLRGSRPRIHRWLGRIYVGDVVMAWLVSLVLAPSAAGGIASATDFFLIGALWIGFTGLGALAIRVGDIGAHRRWMLRSFALAWSPVTMHLYVLLAMTLRSILPLPSIPFEVVYPIGLWLSLLTNLVVVELVLWRPAARIARPRHTALQLLFAPAREAKL
jgi:uncharacterized membrane protein